MIRIQRKLAHPRTSLEQRKSRFRDDLVSRFGEESRCGESNEEESEVVEDGDEVEEIHFVPLHRAEEKRKGAHEFGKSKGEECKGKRDGHESK